MSSNSFNLSTPIRRNTTSVVSRGSWTRDLLKRDDKRKSCTKIPYNRYMVYESVWSKIKLKVSLGYSVPKSLLPSHVSKPHWMSPSNSSLPVPILSTDPKFRLWMDRKGSISLTVLNFNGEVSVSTVFGNKIRDFLRLSNIINHKLSSVSKKNNTGLSPKDQWLTVKG